MPVFLVITADTHVPRRARDLPPQLWQAIDAADVVIHAGDWTNAALVDQVRDRTERTRERPGRLIGVWGNNDGEDVRARVPEIATEVVAGVRLTVVHETGRAAGREERMDRRHPDTDVVIFGHSHIPTDTVTPGGMRLLNPGSPTDRRRQPDATFMTATAHAGRLHDVCLIRIDPAWRDEAATLT